MHIHSFLEFQRLILYPLDFSFNIFNGGKVMLQNNTTIRFFSLVHGLYAKLSFSSTYVSWWLINKNVIFLSINSGFCVSKIRVFLTKYNYIINANLCYLNSSSNFSSISQKLKISHSIKKFSPNLEGTTTKKQQNQNLWIVWIFPI